MKNGVYTGAGTTASCWEALSKDLYHRTVTMKQTLSSHLGRFTILALMEAFRNNRFTGTIPNLSEFLEIGIRNLTFSKALPVILMINWALRTSDPTNSLLSARIL